MIHPFKNLDMHPFNSAIHYAMQCFEGAKAFKGTDGHIRLFRTHQNMFRLKNSCKSLSLPVILKTVSFFLSSYNYFRTSMETSFTSVLKNSLRLILIGFLPLEDSRYISDLPSFRGR